MIGILKLWKNEIIKLYHQTAVRVIFVLTLVIAVLLPLFFGSFSTDIDYQETAETYFSMVDDGHVPDEHKPDYLSTAYTYQFIHENDLPAWKVDEYYGEFSNAILLKIVCEGVIDGSLSRENVFDYYSYLFNPDYDVSYYDIGGDYYEAKSESVTESEVTEDDFYDYIITLDYAEKLNEAEDALEELEKKIVSMTIREYAEQHLDTAEEELKNAKLYLNDIGVLYENGETSLGDYNFQKLSVECSEFHVAYYKSLCEAREEDADWMLSALNFAGLSASDALTSNAVVDETVYAQKYSAEYRMSYDEYVEYSEKEQSMAREVLIMLQYSFENSIPLPQFVEDSTKSVVNGSLSSFASVVIVVMVIMTAVTIAGEYSQGTIRLLLIRPKSRMKIIFSKFLVLLSVGVFVSIVGFGIVFLSSVAVNGANDVLVPDLMYSSRVIEVNAVLYSVLKFALSLFSGVLLVAIAFVMAVVTKKAMLSIVLPLIISLSTEMVQMISVASMSHYPILRFTIFPYLNLGNFLVSPLDTYASYGGGMFFGLFEMASVYLSAGVSLLVGMVMVAIPILILFVIAFAVFGKQQIKS